MSIEAFEFRRIMGHFVSGVTIVASKRPKSGQPYGLTASSIASVSLEPPLVLVCIDKDADSHDCILASGFFSLNILAEFQEKFSCRFVIWDLDYEVEVLA